MTRQTSALKRFTITCAPLAIWLGVIATAQAAGAQPVDTVIHFQACTIPGVEAGCVLAKSGNRTYDVTGAIPHLGPYQLLQGSGTISGQMTVCMQGPRITNFVPDKNPILIECTPPVQVPPSGNH